MNHGVWLGHRPKWNWTRNEPAAPPVVHLSWPHALKVMRDAPKQGQQISYLGYWWNLARTDLYDDVCTSFGEPTDFDKLLPRLEKSACHGARLKRYEDGRRTFAIIDSMTDG